MPVYLLSLAEGGGGAEAHGSIDEELFMACVRGGGARGMLTSRFIDPIVKDWQRHRDQFAEALGQVCRRLYRERASRTGWDASKEC